MDDEQLSQKFRVPMLPSVFLHREDLVYTLTETFHARDADWSPYKLVLFCAPAGYGKTALLVDTIQRLSCVCFWYLLDQTDNDPATFLQRLLACIQHRLPTFGRHLVLPTEESEPVSGGPEGLLARQRVFLDDLIYTFKNELPKQFVLIFCNFHEINQNETLNQLVDYLLAHLPQQGMIALESRSMPNLALAPLIARGQMFGIGSQGLRFSAREVHDLAGLQGISSFSFQEAEQLTRSFEGWIAGILRGSRLGYVRLQRAVSPSEEKWNTSELFTNYTQLLMYLTGEVFKDEMPTYEFLRDTSILERLLPEHCNALLETTDAEQRLAYAEQRGLFVVCDRENSDAEQAREYFCHPALRELFAEDLRQQFPERFRTLHSRAARLLRTSHQYEQALMHAYQAQEYRLAGDLIIEVAATAVYDEQDQMLLHWLKMMPEEIFLQHPQLQLITSTIYLRLGEFALVPPLLDAADALIEGIALEQNQLESLRAELSIARGHLLFFQGEFQQAQELCRRALELLPPDEHKLHISAHQYLAISLIVGLGQVHEGIAHLHQALQMSRLQQSGPRTAILHRLVANAYSWIGNHALAEHHQTRALQIWERQSNAQGIVYGLTSMGLLKMRQGFEQQARELFTQALEQARTIDHFKNGEAYALVALGDLHNSYAQYTEALNYLEDGLLLARACEDHYLICCGICSIASAYMYLGDTATAQLFLRQVRPKESHKKSFEGLLFRLTQGTVYLAQQMYPQAEQTLRDAAEATRQANIQLLHISALLRLLVCYLRQGKQAEAWQVGKWIIDLNKKGDFDFFLQVESQRYNELEAFLNQVTGTELQEQPSSPLQNSLPVPTTQIQVALDQPAPPSIQIFALGEPKVVCNGIAVTRWRMARAMELFFLLLEHGRPMRRDQIALALWPDSGHEQSDSTVRTAIYYVRKALGEESIVFQAGLYSLNLSAMGENGSWYDVSIFHERYDKAKEALEEENDDAAYADLTHIIDLYSGDYVQSFYNDWCMFHRDKLRQMYTDARHQLALIAWRNEQVEVSLQHWQHLLTLDSCNEKAHYGIIRCYLRQGQRDLALKQYQRCKQNLQETLQATPGAALQRLYQRYLH
ncbi:MAG TPA: BTAD domain-containing putative transcriptional regulator [Ktedonobacteraceae bacterium]|nr:BTAD domain-containing putative transcriptional regulator [Ktedonobacteraceae bacterium]